MPRHAVTLTFTVGLALTLAAVSACSNPSTPTTMQSGTVAASAPAEPQETIMSGGGATMQGADLPGIASMSAVDGRALGRYFAVAVSAGFNRNDGYGWAVGRNLQGVFNTAVSTCQSYAGTSCGIDAWCGSPQLTVSRPFVAWARSSVFNPRFLDRGVSGFACGFTTLAAAQTYALSQCSLSGCGLGVSGAVRDAR
jgi:hypothetical protein